MTPPTRRPLPDTRPAHKARAIRRRSYVYIAGRYGDGDGYIAIEERINRAREHAARLAEAGIPYYSPHLNSAHFEAVVPHVTLDFWRQQDAAFLPNASALLVIFHEWSESAGTQAEVDEAQRIGIPIYFTSEIGTLVADWRAALGEEA